MFASIATGAKVVVAIPHQDRVVDAEVELVGCCAGCASDIDIAEVAKDFQNRVSRATATSKRALKEDIMTAENENPLDDQPERLRPARMPFETTVLMSRGAESRPTTLINISATGASLRRPLDWSGAVGQDWVLDMIFGQELHIHLEATVVRVAERHIGFSYSSIPEEKQVPLWNLLGGYADTQEQWSGD